MNFLSASPAEYTSGHIPGAINIPFDQVAKRLDEVDASQDIAVYCMVGPRARKAETALLAAGYKKVFHVGGGFGAWRAAGLPVEVQRSRAVRQPTPASALRGSLRGLVGCPPRNSAPGGA